uniref:Uncharacterized protein n=1 Tax=Ditylenchus dipsaci TaxID=166011 RepID=A0A915E853_9BILA
MNSFIAFVCLAILAFAMHVTNAVPLISSKYISNQLLSSNRALLSDNDDDGVTDEQKQCFLKVTPELANCVTSSSISDVNKPEDLCPILQASMQCWVDKVKDSCGETAVAVFQKLIDLTLDKPLEELPECKKLIQWVEDNGGKFLGEKVVEE